MLRGDEILVYDPAPPAADRAAIDRAVQACPVRAIRVEHEDAPAERPAARRSPASTGPAGPAGRMVARARGTKRRMVGLVAQCLDRCAGRRLFDLVDDLAYPSPSRSSATCSA